MKDLTKSGFYLTAIISGATEEEYEMLLAELEQCERAGRLTRETYNLFKENNKYLADKLSTWLKLHDRSDISYSVCDFSSIELFFNVHSIEIINDYNLVS